MKRSRLLASVIGMATIAVWITAVAAWAWLVINVWPSAPGLFLAVVLLVLLVVSAPRVPRLDKDTVEVNRTECPELFRLFDTASNRLGAPNVQVLAFDAEANAYTLQAGLRRRFVIVIGFPLWEALTPQERVALISHEIAHETNGDIWRTPITGTSIDMIQAWYQFTDPGYLRDASDRGIAALLAWILGIGPHLVLGLLLQAQFKLTMAMHQEAEYRADASSAQVAGTTAVLELLDRLLLASSIGYAARRACEGESDIWLAIRKRFTELSAEDKAAIRQSGLDEEAAVDATHPPTGERISEVKKLGSQPSTLLLDHDWNNRIDDELHQARSVIEQQIRDHGHIKNA